MVKKYDDKPFEDYKPVTSPKQIWDNIQKTFPKAEQNNNRRILMRKFIFIGIGIIVIGGVVAFFMLNNDVIQQIVEKADDVKQAEKVLITKIIGKVSIIREKKKIAISVNSYLYGKDRVIVGPGSEIHLIYNTLGVFKLKENTDIELTSLGIDTQIKVRKGKLLTALRKLTKKQKFKIHAPTAIAGVRGTSFFINADSEKAEIAVLTGSVEVKSGSSKSIVEKHKNAVVGKGTINIAMVDKLIASELKEIASIASVEKYNLKEIKKSIASLELIMRGGSEIGDINEEINIKTLNKERQQAYEKVGSVKEEIIKSLDKVDKEESGYIDQEGF